MKLLLDANLPPKSLRRLSILFPGSRHSFEFFQAEEKDEHIRTFAKREGFTILTADNDFVALLQQFGWPPKIIHLESWGRPTRDFIALIVREVIQIQEFESSPNGLLTLRW